jgi:hypothetical protein
VVDASDNKKLLKLAHFVINLFVNLFPAGDIHVFYNYVGTAGTYSNITPALILDAALAVVSTHQPALGPRGGLWPVLLMCNP